VLDNLLRPRTDASRPRAVALLRASVFAVLPAVLPLAAALHGAPGPRAVELNLGPGDGPYVFGFAPTWEIGEDLVAHHWTRRTARIALPLEATGRLGLLYRFAPPPGGGNVETSLGGVVDHFEAKDARWEEQRASVVTRQRTPLTLDLRVEGSDTRDLGLRLDWLRFEVDAGGRLWLRGAPRFRPMVTVSLAGLLLVSAGWGFAAFLVTAPLALLAAAGLLFDPWLTLRLLSGVPEVLLLVGGAGLALGWLLRARGRVSASDLRLLVALFVAALFLRLIPLNHPSFFHPDLRTHARIAGLVRESGARFFRNPYDSLWRPAGDGGRVASGMWIKSFGGKEVGLPYAIGFHSALAPWELSEDATVTATRIAGGVLAALVPVLVFLLARALLLSPWVAAASGGLAVAIPSLSAELANGAVPACFGHFFDLTFLIWLVTSLRSTAETGHPWRPSTWVWGSAGLAVCYLAYTSSLVVLSLLLFALTGFISARERTLRPAAPGLVLVLTVGATTAIALYYWSFIPAAFHSLSAIAAGRSGPPAAVAVRTLGSVWPALLAWTAPVGILGAAVGIVGLLRVPGVTRAFLSATFATLALVLFARLAAPQVFGWVHDALFAGPILCLGLAGALSALRDRAPAGRGLAMLLLAALLLGGLAQYALLLADQSARAL
jgi:hypothetical protein